MARLAGSLVVLRDQVNALAPGRNKASDGTIGDKKHKDRPSRHNPNHEGVICALDLTDDPGRGCPIHQIADRIRTNPHPNLAYVISNGRVAGRSTGWNWHRYTGKNPHTSHAHFGVGVGPDGNPQRPYDDGQGWAIGGAGGNGGASGLVAGPRTLQHGSRGEDVRGLQKLLIGAGLLPAGGADGVFGRQTEAAVKRFQAQLGVAADGVVGRRTHGAIARLLAFLQASAPPG
jgi:Putative peptidoglycan binding domain